MTPLWDKSFFLLAKGNWMQLIGIIVVFGFYAIGALAKILANRSKTDDGQEKSEISQAVELAKKYAEQKKRQAQSVLAKRRELTSEWDRQQEIKRQRLAQHRGEEEMPQQPQPEPPPMPQVGRQIPQYREVSPLNRVMQAAQQKKEIRRQPVSPVQQTYKKAVKPVKSHKTPVAKMKKTPRPLDVFFRHPNQLRSAIILKEILDKPISMQETFEVFFPNVSR